MRALLLTIIGVVALTAADTLDVDQLFTQQATTVEERVDLIGGLTRQAISRLHDLREDAPIDAALHLDRHGVERLVARINETIDAIAEDPDLYPGDRPTQFRHLRQAEALFITLTLAYAAAGDPPDPKAVQSFLQNHVIRLRPPGQVAAPVSAVREALRRAGGVTVTGLDLHDVVTIDERWPVAEQPTRDLLATAAEAEASAWTQDVAGRFVYLIEASDSRPRSAIVATVQDHDAVALSLTTVLLIARPHEDATP